MKLFLLLGNQLFSPKYLNDFKDHTFFMAEDYGLCTFEKHHKLKILLFLSSMRSFRDEIKSKNFNIIYKDINKDFKLSMVGIELKGGLEAGQKFIESLKMFYHVANIGDARSLAIHPASTTHSQLNEKELAASGVTQSYVRLCIGLEHIDDIIDDLDQALNKSSKSKLKAVS